MKKFYRIEKTVSTTGTTNTIFEYTDYDSALVAVYMATASAISNPNVFSSLGLILDRTGNVFRKEYWERAGMEDPENPQEVETGGE